MKKGLSATETSLALWGAHYDIIHSLLRNESREFPMDKASILIFFAFREMVVSGESTPITVWHVFANQILR